MSAAKGRRAVCYARISDDDTERGAGVERQTKDVLSAVKREGWTLAADVIVDNDRSASRYQTKQREGWARVLDLCESGAADVLVVYDLERMTRQPKELERLIDLADHGLRVVSMTGDLDLSSGDGRMIARVLVAQGAKASDDISRRVRRANEARRAEGRPFWSFRPFGFELDGTHRKREATAVRKVYARFVDGESLGSLADWLNASGWTQPERRVRGTQDTVAKPWTANAVRRLLAADRNVGVQRSRRDGTYDTTTAGWTAIVDRPTFQAAKGLLAVNVDRYAQNGNERRHLLAGLLVCGACGLRLSSLPVTNGSRAYVCRKDSMTHNGCGLKASAPAVERVVVDAVLAWLSDEQNRARLLVPSDAPDATTLLQTIADAADRKAELLALTRDRSLGVTLEDVTPELRDLAATTEQANAALARARNASPALRLPTGDPELLREDWDAMTLAQQQATILDVLEPITVRPATRRGRVFDPERVGIAYRYP